MVESMSVDDLQEATAAPIAVLHIDDDSGYLELTEAFLEAELDRGRVATAAGAEDGLERLDEGCFHCVVCDYDMSRRNGLEVLEAVRAQYPELPFILYTGKGSEEIAAEAINAGVTGYFQKGGPDQHRRLANRIEHATAEYRARIESERYSTVLQALGYPIYVVDADAEFEYVNDAFLELVGYDRDEVIGSKPRLIKSEEGVETANNVLAEVVSSSGPDAKQFQIDVRTKDGDVVPCYDHMAALPFDGEFRGSVGILRDITQEQQQQAELVRKNERLEEFTSIVSHDLRAPLNEAETAAALARSTGEDEYFEKLEAQHDRMERMIGDLLTLAREGRTVSTAEPVDVTELVVEVWERFCGAEDSLELPDDTVVVDGDPARLRQLFENLLGNAVEHGSTSPPSQAREDAVEHGSTSPPSHAQEDAGSENASEPSVAHAPEDTVEHGSTSPPSHAQEDAGSENASEPSVAHAPEDAVEHDSSAVTVTVGRHDDGFFLADDGTGIDEEQREAAFDPGYTTADDGTGFGLTIVRRIADAHGWDISMTESDAGGVRFEFAVDSIRASPPSPQR